MQSVGKATSSDTSITWYDDDDDDNDNDNNNNNNNNNNKAVPTLNNIVKAYMGM
jgi:hypothetical protein